MGNRQTQGQVQIWKVPLPLPEKTIARLNEWLSPEERERIAKFHFLKDRQRYTSARGALRGILASCLGEHPRSLVFGYGPFGKPFLANQNRGNRGRQVERHGGLSESARHPDPVP